MANAPHRADRQPVDDERGNEPGGHVGVGEVHGGEAIDLAAGGPGGPGPHGPALVVEAQNEVAAADAPVGPAVVVGRRQVVEDDSSRKPDGRDVRDQRIGGRPARWILEDAVPSPASPGVGDELESPGRGRALDVDEQPLPATLRPGFDCGPLHQNRHVVGGARQPGLLQGRTDQDSPHPEYQSQHRQDDEELDERNAPLRRAASGMDGRTDREHRNDTVASLGPRLAGPPQEAFMHGLVPPSEPAPAVHHRIEMCPFVTPPCRLVPLG